MACTVGALLPYLLLFSAPSPAPAQGATGEQVYRKMCASCHGEKGEGSKKNPDPLVGDLSIPKLTAYIAKNMPEDAPGKCVGEDAKRVAEYIFNAFYSPAAYVRANPPRIELSRLTVQQYRNAVADLLGSFGEQAKWDEKRGLRGEYYNGTKRPRDDKRVLDRVDPVVSFDPLLPDKLVAEDCAARWTGALLAPETGLYEFNVESVNGVRFWINDLVRPLIDGGVRSGNDVRHSESIQLLGGRVYPLRIEVFKAKSEKTLSIALKWKRPHRAEELVPERLLSPGRFPEVYVVATPFPPDDRSLGYERGNFISKAWDEAATSAALEVAAYASLRLERLAGRKPTAPDAKEKIRDWARRFAERAFRRPLTPELQAFFVDRHFDAAPDLEAAARKAVLLVLKSPRFLYHDVASDAPAVAARISFGLWDSIPDAELLDAARKGQLSTAQDVARQAERMAPDLRTRAKMRQFYQQWLQLDRLRELSKDQKRYPEFTEAIASDLRTSLDLFLDDVTWSDASDFRQLLLADFVHLNGRLAKVYGAELPEDAPFQKVVPGVGKQAGILTHPLLMAAFAYDSTTSPIHRGVFVARSLLGRRMRPPPEAVTPLSPDLHPDMTTRERTALQTRSQTCQSCHATINPLGFAMENFDAVGRFRLDEKGKPIDATGSYAAPGTEPVRFTGARELGEILARSEETQAAFIEHLFQHLVKQPVLAYGADRPAALRQSFEKNGYSLRKLMVEVMVSTALSKGKSP